MRNLLIQRKGNPLEFSYHIVWENDFRALKTCLEMPELQAGKVCVISDSAVAPLYLQDLVRSLEGTFREVHTFVFPEGESSKNLDTVRDLYAFLIQKNFERRDLLIALGGGVTGDLTGFAAATYLRGIDFIQVPTTLLAQVDSSIGGKTGVDLDQYKNMVGAFCQPRLVYMNLAVLSTLSERQFASGMAEVLKTALLRDADFFFWLTEHAREIQSGDREALESMIRRCCEIKAMVVEEDPREQGVRATLNLGHTIGHAIEKLMDFQLLHGECVALGTVAAAYLSWKKGYISREDYLSVRNAEKTFGIPVSLPGISPEAVLRATKSDKKMEQGRIRFILLRPLGCAVIDRSVTDQEILESVDILNGE